MTAEQSEEKLQNSNIINVIRDFSNALTNNQKINKKNYIYYILKTEMLRH